MLTQSEIIAAKKELKKAIAQGLIKIPQGQITVPKEAIRLAEIARAKILKEAKAIRLNVDWSAVPQDFRLAIESVAKHFDLSPSALFSTRKIRPIQDAKEVAVELMVERKKELREIGAVLKLAQPMRIHRRASCRTSVKQAVQQIEQLKAELSNL